MEEKTNNTGQLLKYSTIVFLLTMICSCSAPHYNLQSSSGNSPPDLFENTCQKILLLQKDLIALSDKIDQSEAKVLAQTSISYSLSLAHEYRLVRPAFLHNILVRMGIRDRGLCFHWTEDLMGRLASLDLKGFSLHEGVAYEGSYFREHNSVVVTARGQEFYKGIVLDPWRESGYLYWSAVKTDKYPWKKR